MDRLREEPQGDDEFVLDRQRGVPPSDPIRSGAWSFRRTRRPGHLPARPVPQGARQTVECVNHVALMRNAELVVKYLPGTAWPRHGRNGYSGVFRCAVDVDEAFRRAEPPHMTTGSTGRSRRATRERSSRSRSSGSRSMPRGGGLPRSPGSGSERGRHPPRRIRGCARGSDARCSTVRAPAGVPLVAVQPRDAERARPRPTLDSAAEVWVEGTTAGAGTGAARGRRDANGQRPSALPAGDQPVLRRRRDREARHTRDRLRRKPGDSVSVRAARTRQQIPPARDRRGDDNDGGQVEPEAPVGYTAPSIRAWTDPTGTEHREEELIVRSRRC